MLTRRDIGWMEPDDEGDFWADHDENIHGIIDSDELRNEYPDGYKWDCCNRLGDTKETCQVSWHIPIAGQKRQRSTAVAVEEDKDKENVNPDDKDKENVNPEAKKAAGAKEIVVID